MDIAQKIQDKCCEMSLGNIKMRNVYKYLKILIKLTITAS